MYDFQRASVGLKREFRLLHFVGDATVITSLLERVLTMQALTLLRVYLKKSTQRADDTIHSKSKEIEITVLVYSTARKNIKLVPSLWLNTSRTLEYLFEYHFENLLPPLLNIFFSHTNQNVYISFSIAYIFFDALYVIVE